MATYSLALSDEDVGGEATGLAMTLTLEGIVALAGDGSLNNDVGAEDYTIWADGFGMASPGFTDGDYSLNGSVGPEDYTLWADNFGMSATGPVGAPAAVPEPATWALMVLGVFLLLLRRRDLALVRD